MNAPTPPDSPAGAARRRDLIDIAIILRHRPAAVARPPRKCPLGRARFGAAGLFAFVALHAALPGCSKPAAEATASAEQPPVVVTTVPLRTVRLQRSVPVVGTLHGYDDVQLTTKVDGRVSHVLRDVGDTVIPGEVLLELDPTDYELALSEARRGLEAELARLGLEALPVGPFDPVNVPAVVRAAVSADNAKSRFARVKGLFDGGTTSREDFDTARTDLRLAEANTLLALTEARATLAAARLKAAAVATAEQKLRDCHLLAPEPPGWAAWAAAVGPAAGPLRYAVAQRMVGEGEMIRTMPTTNVFRLVVDHVLKLKAAVPEKHVAEVKVGQPAEVTVDAFPGRPFRGVVARVNRTVDAASRTFGIEVEVPNGDGALKAGTFAKATVLTRTDDAVRVVPPAAVVAFAGVNKVFVVDGAKAKAVEVKLGQRDREQVEVTGEFPAGAVVIVSGLSQVVDGSPIRAR